MNEHLRALFDAVRRACAPGVWSRAIELARAGAVLRVRGDDEEQVFRVATRGGMISPTVTLFPADADWECECSSRDSACEHAAAAVIAWQRAVDEGRELRSGADGGQVGYRFRRAPGGLSLERVIEQDGETHVLETTLSALASGRVAGPRFVAAKHDLTIELALGTHRRGLLPRQLVNKLFARLAQAGDVKLDERPVRVQGEPVLPRVRVLAQDEGFRLVLEPAAELSERFANGIARCGEVLRPLGEAALTAAERQELESGRYFGPESAGELVTGVLPALRRRLPVELETDRLPQLGSEEPPRVTLEVVRRGERLEVLASLVYGRP
ncbi:MAG TPA: hypothetical protein VJS92_10900, partial [Candidatus Polarisedimenticolaceae bacterium]|nr:hypothetical protein [Candidatus Polarisedimenticolaceae bacterium]